MNERLIIRKMERYVSGRSETRRSKPNNCRHCEKLTYRTRRMEQFTLYLIWHSAKKTEVEISEPLYGLSDGLFLVRSERTLSRLYHAIKHQLPEGTALIVAPLEGSPKAWQRAR